MRRDYFTVTAGNVGDTDDNPEGPTVAIEYDGPSDMLSERLTDETGSTLDAGDIDVTFRLTTPVDDDDPRGVLSIANRMTGEFVLEANADADELLTVVRSARATGDEDDVRYRIRVTDADGKSIVYDKRTLLVYDDDGSLLRQESLIPGGVEL